MKNDERNPKLECRTTVSSATRGFVIRIWELRIMETPLGLTTVHWDHEPFSVRKRSESADKSDALQTLRAQPSQRTTRQRLECARLQRRFPMAVCDLMTRPVHGEP